jgi:hypothetical protein
MPWIQVLYKRSEGHTHLKSHKPDAFDHISNEQQVFEGAKRSHTDTNVHKSNPGELFIKVKGSYEDLSRND